MKQAPGVCRAVCFEQRHQFVIESGDEFVGHPRLEVIDRGDSGALRVLSAAAQARQRVHLRYRSAQRADRERDFDPYGLAWRAGRWYVVGHCHLRNGLRSFRLDRIENVTPLPASFGRPDRFDALAHLAFSLATLPREHALEVLLRTDLATARCEVFDAIGLLESVDGGVTEGRCARFALPGSRVRPLALSGLLQL